MKGYCFIDMHIHSMFSNEEGVTQTPKKILDATLELIEEYKAKTQPTIVKFIEKENAVEEIANFFLLDDSNEVFYLRKILKEATSSEEKAKEILNKFSRACISITDHNSILGSVEAVKVIKSNPKKYENIDFIPGIEFNAGLKNLRVNEHGQSVYSKCHLLGYGFNIEDENLKIFSKLYQLTLGSEKINIGQAISASRNAFRLNYNVSIPLSAFKGLLERAIPLEKRRDISLYKTYNSLREEFLGICANYLPNGKSIAEFDEQIKNSVFPAEPIKVKQNAGHGKLQAIEIIDIVKKAGGKTSIAHPSMISKNKKLYKDQNTVREIVSDIVKLIQENTDNGLDALEILHHDNASVIKALLKVAEKFDLYVTAGSDCHNHTANIENQNWKGKGYISDCFNDLYNQISVKDYNVNGKAKGLNNVNGNAKGFNKVIFLPIISLIKTGKSPVDHQGCLIRDGKMRVYSWDRAKDLSYRIFVFKQTRKIIAPREERQTNKETAFEEELKNLTSEPIAYEDVKPSNLWRTKKTWMEELEDLKNTLEKQENAQARKTGQVKNQEVELSN